MPRAPRPCSRAGAGGAGTFEGAAVVAVVGSHRHRKGQVLDGAVIVTELRRRQTETEVRVVVGRVVLDDRREVVTCVAKPAGAELGARECLTNRPGSRLGCRGVLEQGRGRGRVAGGEELQPADVPVVGLAAGLGRPLLLLHLRLAPPRPPGVAVPVCPPPSARTRGRRATRVVRTIAG